MFSYPIAPYEKERLQELLSYQILDTPSEKEFDDMVNIAAKTFNVKVAAVTFVDAKRQWLKAKVGVDLCEADRNTSVCNYTILQNNITEIPDLRADERFKGFQYVTQEPFLRFYAGFPLVTQNGYRIGVFCLLDTEVRTLSTEEKNLLQVFAKNAMAHVELRLRNMELENLNEVQKRIACTLSHDIKNPLSTLKMMLDMQDEAEDSLNAEDNEMIKKLLRGQVDNTLSLLNNMIQWGKLEMQDKEARVKQVNLRQLITECIKEIEIDAILKNNVFVNEVPATIETTVNCKGLCFALRNLLSNANKFTDSGTITVSYMKDKAHEYISVTDTGVGMSAQQVTELNNNEGSQYANGTRNEKSNGLGLSLVNEYLIKNHSHLHYESLPGYGTTVSFNL